jgi:hypothetical protein
MKEPIQNWVPSSKRGVMTLGWHPIFEDQLAC